MARNRTSRMAVVGIGLVALAVAGAGAWRHLAGSFHASGSAGSSSPKGISRSSGPSDRPDRAADAPGLPVRPGAGEAMADRPEETVQALASNQETLRSRVEGLAASVESGIGGLGDRLGRIGEELSVLRTEQAALAETGAAATELDRLRLEMRADLEAMFGEYEARAGTDYPVDGAAPAPRRGVPGADGFLWYAAAAPETAAAPGLGGALATLPALPGPLGAIAGSEPLLPASEGEPEPEPVPVYTVPADATLVGARGLTALIGRVPVQGQVVDPFPFKVVAGRENLLPGGQVLPELERTVWSGVATGDAALHCVTGEITRATFLFRDGTIRTWPREDGAGGRLGWISDERGYPCVPGTFVSNLPGNVRRITSASFAAGLARAFGERETETTREGAAVTRSVTGDPGEYALGQGLAGGIDAWARTVAERAGEAFDAVVVSPGRTLTVHVDRAIPIDWPPGGPRIRHLPAPARADAAQRPGRLD